MLIVLYHGTAEWNKHVFCFSTVRNKDMSWPEEMSFIANSSKMDRHKGKFKERTVQPLACSDRMLTLADRCDV